VPRTVLDQPETCSLKHLPKTRFYVPGIGVPDFKPDQSSGLHNGQPCALDHAVINRTPCELEA
jgi:hypothetical protein